MDLPRSATELARDTPVRLVPYAFARLNGALLLEISEKEALVCLRRGARPQALAELRRALGVPVRVAEIEAQEAFERRLAQAYSQASQSAAYVAGAIEQDMDLSRLVQDSTGMTMEKVPLLGDLPVLGALFRYETRRQTKTNLMVFLRPLIMRDSASYRGVTAERYRDMLQEQERAAIPPRPMLPDIPPPRLPPQGFE